MSDAPITNGTAITVLAVVVVGLVSVVLALLRMVDGERNRAVRKELDTHAKGIEVAATDHRQLAERLRIDELATLQLKSDHEVERVRRTAIEAAVARVEHQQVPRAEWEQRQGHVDRALDEVRAQNVEILRQLRSSSSARIPATTSPR